VWLWGWQGYKVMPFSTACGTPLSNFEAGQYYQEVRPLLVRVRVSVDLVLHIKAATL
jgi:isoleucyl-tRNA synthetase